MPFGFAMYHRYPKLFQLYATQELTPELWEQFKARAQRDGHTISHAFYLMIQRYLDDAARGEPK
jgi:hypothetical protein